MTGRSKRRGAAVPTLGLWIALGASLAAACDDSPPRSEPSDGGERDATPRIDAAAADAAATDAAHADATSADVADAACAALGPSSAWHLATNATVASGAWAPEAVGFNLADVSSVDQLDLLPDDAKGLVWVGTCDGADDTFIATVQPFAGHPKLFGFYLMDEPDPTGQWAPQCDAANLKAESDWIHANIAGAKTFIVLMDMGGSGQASFEGTYNPTNTGIDLYGVDPYPCRATSGCTFEWIGDAVDAAVRSGIPLAAIVPVYQAFGGGDYISDTDEPFALPTPAQATELLATWAAAVPSPVMDMVYSWGSQNGDVALGTSTELQRVFAAHHAGCAGR